MLARPQRSLDGVHTLCRVISARRSRLVVNWWSKGGKAESKLDNWFHVAEAVSSIMALREPKDFAVIEIGHDQTGT